MIPMSDRPRPVILDTDIGTDIDDTWALAMLLRSPELDLRLVTTCTGDTTYRAKLVAKMLEIAGRADVPIGIGPPTPLDDRHRRVAGWVEDYDLAAYPGPVHQDGVQALVDGVMGAGEPPTLIAIGPLTNLAEALRRRPEIGQRTRFVGMQGAVYRGYDGSPEVTAEYNIAVDIPAAQAVFAAPWHMTLTPLDTCGVVVLEGEDYRAVAESRDPLARAVMESYQVWLAGEERDRSSVLFDTVAVYLAYSEELLEMRQVALCVTDAGITAPAAMGKPVDCAVEWRDLRAFERLVAGRVRG
jgi:inosine-uridine nucleoside N-ribohydrolase